jgi:hypothetical protein
MISSGVAKCPGRPIRVALPRLVGAGQVQVGHGEAGEPGLGSRPPPGRALVADLPAGAGRRTREGRDRRRVVVRLDLHEDVHGVLVRGIPAGLALLGREPAWDDPALHHRGVVGVGDHGALGLTASVCRIIPNSERACTSPSTTKSGVEDLVAAVLGVGLGEHHQLDVAGVAPEPGERLDEVVDLVVGQGQPVGRVGLDERLAPPPRTSTCSIGSASRSSNSAASAVGSEQHALGHPVVEQVRSGGPLRPGERRRPGEPVLGDPLDPADVDAAVVGDVGRLGRPRRDRARGGGDDDGGEVSPAPEAAPASGGP